jgi:hypothetical protein
MILFPLGQNSWMSFMAAGAVAPALKGQVFRVQGLRRKMRVSALQPFLFGRRSNQRKSPRIHRRSRERKSTDCVSRNASLTVFLSAGAKAVVVVPHFGTNQVYWATPMHRKKPPLGAGFASGY